MNFFAWYSKGKNEEHRKFWFSKLHRLSYTSQKLEIENI